MGKKMSFLYEAFDLCVWTIRRFMPRITFLGPHIGICVGKDIVRLKPSCFSRDIALVIMHLFPHYKGRIVRGIHMAAYHYHLGFKPLAAMAVGNRDWRLFFLPVWTSYRHYSEVTWFGHRLYTAS
jgi:hypothetical protein